MEMAIRVSVVVVIGLGVLLFWSGWRGRRVDHKRRCRKCKHDLSDLSMSENLCPACNADLSKRGAVLLGSTKKIAWRIIAGSVLLLPSLAFVGFLMWAIQTNADLERYKPIFWLAIDLESNDSERAMGAIETLRKRLDADEVGEGGFDTLVNLIAEDASRDGWAMREELLTLIERGRAAGVVSDEAWRVQARKRLAMKLFTREKVTIGDAIPVRVLPDQNFKSGDLLRFETKPIRYAIGNAQVAWDDLDEDESLPGAITWSRSGRDGGHEGLLPTSGVAALPASLSPGAATLVLTYRVTCVDLTGDREAPLDTWEVDVTKELQLLAANEPSVKLVKDAQQLAAVKRSIYVSLLQSPDGPLIVQFSKGKRDITWCYDVYVRRGQDMQRLATIGSHMRNTSIKVPEVEGIAEKSIVDIVLRPNARKATETLQTYSIVDGEIVYESRRVAEGPSSLPSSPP